jgi:hypothetical protein
VGQTFYWPSVLGFVAERFPKGGALTLNTVSAIGLLTVGIFGFPFLGAVQDHYNAVAVLEAQPALVQKIQSENRMVDGALIVAETNLFGVGYSTIKHDAIMAQPEFPEEGKETLKATLSQTGRSTLRVATWLPISMVIGFALMMLWFKKNGGYKPIILSEEK